MNFFNQIVQESAKKMVILNRTKEIKPDDLDFPEWKFMQMAYDDEVNMTWLTKAIASVTNSILYQRRIYFCLERNNVRKVLKNDKNWKSQIGLSNDKYSSLIFELVNSGLIEAVDQDCRPQIYKLVQPEIVKLIKVDEALQYSEVIDFVENNTEDVSSDGYSDGYSDVEEEVEEEREVEGTTLPDINDILIKVTKESDNGFPKVKEELLHAIQTLKDSGYSNRKITEEEFVLKKYYVGKKFKSENMQKFKERQSWIEEYIDSELVELKNIKTSKAAMPDDYMEEHDMTRKEVKQGQSHFNALDAAFGVTE